jgi:hypothetical protein
VLSDEELADLQTLRRNIQSGPVVTVSLRAVANRVNHLRLGAQPGHSGSRNSHLRRGLQARHGLKHLHKWSTLWAHGLIPPHIAALFVSGWIAPLSKPNGRIRPIALFEAPLKLAAGVL